MWKCILAGLLFLCPSVVLADRGSQRKFSGEEALNLLRNSQLLSQHFVTFQSITPHPQGAPSAVEALPSAPGRGTPPTSMPAHHDHEAYPQGAELVVAPTLSPSEGAMEEGLQAPSPRAISALPTLPMDVKGAGAGLAPSPAYVTQGSNPMTSPSSTLGSLAPSTAPMPGPARATVPQGLTDLAVFPSPGLSPALNAYSPAPLQAGLNKGQAQKQITPLPTLPQGAVGSASSGGAETPTRAVPVSSLGPVPALALALQSPNAQAGLPSYLQTLNTTKATTNSRPAGNASSNALPSGGSAASPVGGPPVLQRTPAKSDTTKPPATNSSASQHNSRTTNSSNSSTLPHKNTTSPQNLSHRQSALPADSPAVEGPPQKGSLQASEALQHAANITAPSPEAPEAPILSSKRNHSRSSMTKLTTPPEQQPDLPGIAFNATPPDPPSKPPPIVALPPALLSPPSSSPAISRGRSRRPSEGPNNTLRPPLTSPSPGPRSATLANVTQILNSPASGPDLITAIRTQAASGKEAHTAVAASLQIQGPGCTPFNANNQNLVVNAFASIITSVTRADIKVRYFTSDDQRIPNFGTAPDSGRRLLSSPVKIKGRRLQQQDIQLKPQATFGNTVFVTMQFNAGSNGRTQTVMADVEAALLPGGAYNTVPIQEALQSLGQPDWSVKLLSSDAVDPAQPLAVELLCDKSFGKICLDGSGLSQGAVKGIIAAGCIFIVLASALICVFLDVGRRSGRMGELEMQPETPRTPMQRAVNSLTGYLQATMGMVKRPHNRAAHAHGPVARVAAEEANGQAGSPVTATVELAETRGQKTAFSKGKPRLSAPSTVIVDFADTKPAGSSGVSKEPADPQKKGQSLKSETKSGPEQEAQPGKDMGTKAQGNQEPPTGIAPLEDGQAIGAAAAVDRGFGAPGASLRPVKTKVEQKPEQPEKPKSGRAKP